MVAKTKTGTSRLIPQKLTENQELLTPLLPLYWCIRTYQSCISHCFHATWQRYSIIQ